MTNAERLRRSAETCLATLKQHKRVGNMREDIATRHLYKLGEHARFMDETLPGIELGTNDGPTKWTGTAYRALQAIAKGARA